MRWKIEMHSAVEDWLAELQESDPDSVVLIGLAIGQLAAEGPSAGRPLVDHIKGSRYHNMKELRPASTGRSEVRILFAFDPRRAAILLVAGDNCGKWQSWYRKAIRLADQRFADHLESLEMEEPDE